ncbi:glycosyltransferase [Magnetococcus marinus]|nr:glycosyltransferase [Magnetococcus marinus]
MDPQPALLILVSQAGYPTHAPRIRALGEATSLYLAGPGQLDQLDGLPFFACDATTPVESLLGELQERGFRPDALLQLESLDFYPQGLIGQPLPAFYYATDIHQHIHWQMEYGKLFDALFIPSPHFLEPMRRNGHVAVYAAPEGVDLTLFSNPGLSRDLDLVFVGSTQADQHPLRPVLHTLLRDQGYKIQFSPRADAATRAKLYGRSRVVLHQGEPGIFSATQLEGAACGAVPCTTAFSGLEPELRSEQECITYRDEHDLLHRLESLLGEGPRWHQLSDAAQQRVKQASWGQRSQQMLQNMLPFLRQKRTHFAEADQMKAHAFVYHVRGFGGRGIRMLNTLSNQFPEDVELHLLKALSYLNSNLYLEAARELDTLLTQATPPPTAFVEQIADILLNTFELAGHTAGALHTAQALSLPSDAQKRRLARLLSRTSDPLPPEIMEKLRIPAQTA